MTEEEVITPEGLGLLVATWWGPPMTERCELHVRMPDGRIRVFEEETEATRLRDVKRGPYR